MIALFATVSTYSEDSNALGQCFLTIKFKKIHLSPSLSSPKCFFMNLNEDNAPAIFGYVNENGLWRQRHTFELYKLFKEADVIKSIKIGRLRFAGHVCPPFGSLILDVQNF
ncbi:hypothetical protein TNCV_12411 [Trichonephila clavipes]|nr:hypothetical protein TNCV_12411 [Trichonephila clavipes]